MKNTTITTLAALLLGSAVVNADPAYTKPAGYVTHTLKTGQFNLIGLTLHQPVIATGDFTAVSGTTLTDSDVDFGTALTSGKTYILEIIEASDTDLNGAIQEVTVWSGNTITTPQDLVAQGLAIGDSYQMREVPTLESIFGTTDSLLKKGVVSTIADIVWIPNGSGGYNRYFLATTNQWKNAANNGLAPNVPVCYTDGMLVERKGADVDLVFTGSVKTTGTSIALVQGFNPIGATFPAGSTLQNSGLSASLKPGVVSTIGDIVWIPDGLGGYTRYFYHTTNQWRNAATNVAAPADVPMTSGVFIQRKDAAVNVKLTPPSTYSNL